MKRTLIIKTPTLVGQEVKLQGWVVTKRDHGKLTFIDLRDKSGLVQCVGFGQLGDVTPETVVAIEGLVKNRPAKLVNKDLVTGSIEIEVKKYQILNLSKELPIPIDADGYDINEESRLKYRYLDLRRARMQKNIRLRSSLTREICGSLDKREFVNIETPMLTKSTKEGARDFVVPSRFQPGKFYALPQSPQQYKQLLMTAGFERYYQIARCIRDEDLRADRGFEFTQVDLEMSFVDRADVMQLVESVVKEAVVAVGGKLKEKNFPVLTYGEAMSKYGSDKFDLRSEADKKAGKLAFAWVIDFPFFKKVDTKDVAEVRDGKSGWTFTHNPFSQPQDKYLEQHLAGKKIDQILTTQYDLVCNGYEVGGGSIRAHHPEVLMATFKTMGYTDQQIQDGVGHMLVAFGVGTPPHGGIALGLDRLVMLLAGETSLKEITPFPMSSSGRTAIMDAPAPITAEQAKELGLKINS
ncbi:aspartate--tRNA ligase [Patescibacteria group bacterium]|nr:aspartate--tRNA ligase [Patescibacteria group bacterium]